MNTNPWQLVALKCGLYRGDADVSTPEKWENEQSRAACALLDRLEAVQTALSYLRSSYVQDNKYRLGALGAQDIDNAIAALTRSME